MEKGIRRRDFFKVLGASGGVVAAASACADPPEKLVPYLLPPDNVEFVPGVPLEYATTCMECPAHCGMVVSTREARAIKAEGNADHPISQGALCARGQATLQTHYNPARLSGAAQRKGEKWEAMDWAAAEALLAAKIKAVPDKRQIVYMTGNVAGTRARFVDQWLAALGASPKVVIEPLELHSIRAANDRLFHRAEVPLYRIAEADYLLNFGSEFLETWGNPVANNREFAAMHAYNDQTKRKGKFVHVGPHVALTGANADQWVPARPGSEAVLALALARSVLESTRTRLPGGEAERIAAALKPYTLERAEAASGVKADVLKKLADEFGAAKAGLALAGGNTLASDQATAAQVAVGLLNYVAGNVGKTVAFGAGVQLDPSTPFSQVLPVLQRMQAGQVKLLIVDGTNPAYFLPPATKVAEALSKVDFIVSLSPAQDETTKVSHLVLPGQSALERWGDAAPQRGVYSLQQPVMAPIYPVKAAEDTLLAVAKALGLSQFKATPTYRDYLRGAWQQVQKEVGASGDFDAFWREGLRRGGVFQQVSYSGGVRLNPEALSGLAAETKLPGEGLVLLPITSLRHRDGRGASNPWLQEIPDPVSQVVWGSWAEINPRVAEKMGIGHGDLVRISSAQGSVELPAYLSYGVQDDAIAIPLGQGHSGSGHNADGFGVNVLSLLPPTFDRASGQLAYLSTRVKVVRTAAALEPSGLKYLLSKRSGERGPGEPKFLSQNDGSPRQQGREIIQTMTLEEAKEGHEPERVEPLPPEDFYPPREKNTPGYHNPYRFAMTVDVDRCTGCSACVVACYAENNIAVVGRERNALGREMSWIRIERFYAGEGDSFSVLMQPMFCQHCSNAGCEPVCPVYATYHNPDGLNAQVYNRCVGTRYCSNNCDYKVRRFNWFTYEWEAPLHLQLNPDVTVRSKGVMEKCTLCVQRIQRAKMHAESESRIVRDGEITPACVQTCPTHALTFGNLADPNSAVSKKAMRGEKAKERVRQYEVLQETRNLPAMTYLRKVTFSPVEEA